MQQSSDKKLCIPFPFGLAEYLVMEACKYRSQLSVQLMHQTQCAHAACLHSGLIYNSMIHTAPSLVSNKAKMADSSIQLNTRHALQPQYQNETLHSSVCTKDELKLHIACEVNTQSFLQHRWKSTKGCCQYKNAERLWGLAFSEDRFLLVPVENFQYWPAYSAGWFVII